MTYRYPQAHVDEMIAQVRAGGRVEPHAAVVLAAEVLALREETLGLVARVARVEACIASAEERPETWAFRDLVLWVRAALKGAQLTTNLDEMGPIK